MTLLILLAILTFVPLIIASFLIKRENPAITFVSFCLFFLLPILGPLIYIGYYYYSNRPTQKPISL